MLPQVIVHSVISLDGKIEGFQPEAIEHYYELSTQSKCDTWLIGTDTLLEGERIPDAQVHQKDKDGEPLEAMAERGNCAISVAF